MNILIVDDEKLIRDVIKEYLILNDYKTYEASNGEDAIKIVKNNRKGNKKRKHYTECMLIFVSRLR